MRCHILLLSVHYIPIEGQLWRQSGLTCRRQDGTDAVVSSRESGIVGGLEKEISIRS